MDRRPGGRPRVPDERSNIVSLKDLTDGGGHDDGEFSNPFTNNLYSSNSRNTGVEYNEFGPPNMMIQQIFHQAMNSQNASHERTGSLKTSFSGQGHRLGDTNFNEGDPSGPHGGPVSNPPPTQTDVLVTFYRDGFTLDGSDTRNYKDPENVAFLADIQHGIVPRELESMATPNREVRLNLANRMTEQSPGSHQVDPRRFLGQGQALAHEPGAWDPHAEDRSMLGPEPTLDPSAPTIHFMLKLANGRQHRIQLNHSHRVRDIHAWIAARAPSKGPYRLSIPFPRTALDDSDQSVQDAGLDGIVVYQTMMPHD